MKIISDVERMVTTPCPAQSPSIYSVRKDLLGKIQWFKQSHSLLEKSAKNRQWAGLRGGTLGRETGNLTEVTPVLLSCLSDWWAAGLETPSHVLLGEVSLRYGGDLGTWKACCKERCSEGQGFKC